MISQIRTAASILMYVSMALPVGNAQPGDRALDPKARVLNVLFPVEVSQRPYFFKVVLRFDDADTQVVIVVYPDKDKYWVRRCEVTTFSLNDDVKRELAESLSQLPPEATDEAVRAIASGLRVEVNRIVIAPEALDKSLSELKSIRISPLLAARISVDNFSEYEFWYDSWQESVHYSITGSPGKAPQDELVRWMLRFKADLPGLLKKSSGGSPFHAFSVDESLPLDDTTPVLPRRGTGLAFPGGPPFRF
jgi:hypothetical protein